MIGTPLGNLGDITQRAMEALAETEVLFAEDTREVRKLLQALGIPQEGRQISSLAGHNMKSAVDRVLGVLASNRSVGFVSDRGTPAISDPGAFLAQRAWEEGHEVIPVPGPSSVTALLSVAGLPADRFLFVGFLPTKPKDREHLWQLAESSGLTTVCLESPRRLGALMEELAERFPQAEVMVGHEMTKTYESYHRFSIASVPELPDKGEFTVAFKPGSTIREGDWMKAVELRLASDKQWAKQEGSRLGVAAKELYNALQKQRPKS